MSKLRNERRSDVDVSFTGLNTTSDTIRKALLIQQRDGSVSALEYLKRGSVPPAVIERVISGVAIREEDRLSLLQNEADTPA